MKLFFTCSIACILLFSSCKKGPEDPFISFKSRKARVAGEWRLKEGSLIIGTTNVTAAERYNQSYVFIATKYTVTFTSAPAVASTRTGFYSLNLIFDKKGTVTLKETLNNDRIVATGTWDFNNGISKDVKKKEVLVMSLKSLSEGATNAHFFNQGAMNFTYKIKELKNKEMILTADLPIYIDKNGPTQSFLAEFTLVQ